MLLEEKDESLVSWRDAGSSRSKEVACGAPPVVMDSSREVKTPEFEG